MSLIKKSLEVSKRKQEIIEGKHGRGQLYFMLVAMIIVLATRTAIDFRIRIAVGVALVVVVVYKDLKAKRRNIGRF
jgi:Ca2+/Na+ antiporter